MMVNVQFHHLSHIEQPVNIRFRGVSELLCQFGLYHVPPDPVVLREQIVQQPTVLQHKTQQRM